MSNDISPLKLQAPSSDPASVGHHFHVRLNGTSSLDETDILVLETLQPIGVHITVHNFASELPYLEWLDQYEKLIKDVYKRTGREKMLFSIDHEGGRVHRLPEPMTHFPAAIHYADEAQDVAEVFAKELASLGLNILFGPCADIHSNPDNPIIGARSFGKEPDLVADATVRFCKALEKEGVLSCIKHFPGHGDTSCDSHLELPTLPHGYDVLKKRELIPFQKAIKSGVSAVMTAHLLMTQFDATLPATLSSAILKKILREDLGFSGVIFTDDLDMKAIARNFSQETIIANAIPAGCDILLLNHHHEQGIPMAKELIRLYESGDIAEEILTDSRTRIEDLLHKAEKNKIEPLDAQTIKKHERVRSRIHSKIQNRWKRYKPEVIPKTVLPPTSEQTLKVGIVLEEDKKTEIVITFPEDLKIEDSALSKGRYSLRVDKDNTLSLYDSSEKLLIEKDSPLSIPAFTETLTPQNGITVENIVAGREFHWKKELTQTLPGALEAHAINGKLVLVNTTTFEDYISCVISSEMSAACPGEFIKAQAVAARTWATVFLGDKHIGQPFTICNDDDCQRYQGTTHLTQEAIDAVRACRGEFLLDQGGYCVPAYYSKCCGGVSESSQAAFGFPHSNLQSVRDKFCDSAVVSKEDYKKYLGSVDTIQDYFRWEYTLTHDTLLANIQQKLDIKDAARVTSIIPGTKGASGRYLSCIIEYIDTSNSPQRINLPNQYAIRDIFHESFLFSSAFEYKVHATDDAITNIALLGRGWGHGVGLCQIGALGMALKGKKHKEIGEHFFTGSTIKKCYD